MSYIRFTISVIFNEKLKVAKSQYFKCCESECRDASNLLFFFFLLEDTKIGNKIISE